MGFIFMSTKKNSLFSQTRNFVETNKNAILKFYTYKVLKAKT